MGKVRDAERSKRNILDAAREEFAAHGLSGARMQAIAKRARVRKQLIFHYFPSKDALYKEVIEETFRRREQWQVPDEAARMFRERFEFATSDRLWLRFLLWEGIHYRAGNAVRWHQRRVQALTRMRQKIRAHQKSGALKAGMAPELLQLAMFALANYPLTFPQITELTVGVEPESPAFRRKWGEFLDAVGAIFSQRSTDRQRTLRVRTGRSRMSGR